MHVQFVFISKILEWLKSDVGNSFYCLFVFFLIRETVCVCVRFISAKHRFFVPFFQKDTFNMMTINSYTQFKYKGMPSVGSSSI